MCPIDRRPKHEDDLIDFWLVLSIPPRSPFPAEAPF